MDLEEKINLAVKWILESERLVIFTGAGISTDSGIPDYRGPNGVWTRRDKGLPPPKPRVPWDKVKPNMGHYSSVRHEILIIAGKGTCAPTVDGKIIQSIDSVQSIPKSARHSEKPHEFYNIIETLYPDTKKIELFARNKRKGWDNWGNEV